VRVLPGHAQADSGRLMDERDLSNERIDIRILQQGRERVPPRFGAGGRGVTDLLGQANERSAYVVRLDGAGVAPNSLRDFRQRLPGAIAKGGKRSIV